MAAGCRQGRAGEPPRPRRSPGPARRTQIVDFVGYGNRQLLRGGGADPRAQGDTKYRPARCLRLRRQQHQRRRLRRALAAGSAQLRDDRIRRAAGADADAADRRRCREPRRASVLAGGARSSPCTVTPGANPTSTDITVIGDLTAIGGSDTQPSSTTARTATRSPATTSSRTSADRRRRDHCRAQRACRPSVTDAQEPDGRRRAIALTVAEPPAAPIEISEIQGAAHISPPQRRRRSPRPAS